MADNKVTSKPSANQEILTEQEVVTVAQRVTGDNTISVLKHQFSSASKEVLGMLGAHNNLAITIQKGNRKEPEEINLFVKSVPYENAARADFILNGGIFMKESLLFEKAVPILTENYKSDKWAATCYLAKKDVLVMENLRLQGYKLLDALYDDLVAIKSVLAAIARFHSCSILAESRLQQMGKEPHALDKYFTDLFNETMFVHTGRASVWVQASIKAAGNVAAKYGYDAPKVSAACSKVFDIIQPSKRHRNVICHGDLWTNNVMLNDQSQPMKCVLVDFQLIRYAPLVLDILQLLHINTSRKFRNQFERTMVEHYHSILEKTIEDNDQTGKTEIPTLEEILTGLDDLRLFGAIVACFYRLLGPKVAIECAKTPEQNAKFLEGDVFDVILSFMETDELYKSQIEDAIHEMGENSQKI